ncbi:hypothetical protein [Cupriavidus sp. D384]|uniref:hypothetical protein n=1 Tax=Cupriavidus sp. D384 TaxID=1538095 RepID=UPI0012E9294C|nr:hypothetical protein [Cupriavidus sp. D384]
MQIKDMVDTTDSEHLPTFLEQEAALVAFLDYFCRPDEREMWAIKVARALAEDALERLRNGKQPAEYNSANIAGLVSHNVAPEDATRWLAGIWAKLKRRMDEREAGMQDTAGQAHLPFYAWPRKTASSGGAGNSSTYGIAFLPVPQVEGQAEAPPVNGIAYVRDVTLRPHFGSGHWSKLVSPSKDGVEICSSPTGWAAWLSLAACFLSSGSSSQLRPRGCPADSFSLFCCLPAW